MSSIGLPDGSVVEGSIVGNHRPHSSMERAARELGCAVLCMHIRNDVRDTSHVTTWAESLGHGIIANVSMAPASRAGLLYSAA